MATNNAEYMREWRKKHPDYRREQYRKNREKVLAQNKAWRERNKAGIASQRRGKLVSRRESNKRWRDKNREHVRTRYREYVENNRERITHLNRRFQLGRYGLTHDDYNRMVKKQNNTCAICPRTGTDKLKLVVDHCHDTGKVRSLLCHQCNRALGLMGDNHEVVLKAVKYLRKWERRHTKGVTHGRQPEPRADRGLEDQGVGSDGDRRPQERSHRVDRQLRQGPGEPAGEADGRHPGRTSLADFPRPQDRRPGLVDSVPLGGWAHGERRPQPRDAGSDRGWADDGG